MRPLAARLLLEGRWLGSWGLSWSLVTATEMTVLPSRAACRLPRDNPVETQGKEQATDPLWERLASMGKGAIPGGWLLSHQPSRLGIPSEERSGVDRTV